jgi:preprotein translocase SecE subunit
VANKKTKKSSSKTARSASTSNGENVVRIKASPSTKKKTTKAEATAPAASVKAAKPARVKKPTTGTGIRGFGVLGIIGGYFKGAWLELRQVRWPNRRATWSLTGAVLAYSAFFVILVLLLDAGFKLMFDFILKK